MRQPVDSLIAHPSNTRRSEDRVACRLHREARAHMADPGPQLHSRIMAAVSASRSIAPGPESYRARALFFNRYAAAACVALCAAVVVLDYWRVQPAFMDGAVGVTDGQSPESPVMVHDAIASQQPVDSNVATPYSLAALDTFLEGPMPALRQDVMRPLQQEFDRLASAGSQFLRATLDTLPPSLRAAASGR